MEFVKHMAEAAQRYPLCLLRAPFACRPAGAVTPEHSLQELILEKKGMERVAEAVRQGKMVVAMDDMGWRLEFANDVAASLAGRGQVANTTGMMWLRH